ncbi:hypothetical protein [Microbacterium sp. VKM Ac-2923]|uniref:hypothetical protein n=1 Tax=Microbacterium sp. VKM Ac-2923 TaxID=2929476 RepID=UPI001FB46C19|nr:hypothetical protein [Microbacterium sp. VKM Ac-2923]MCJ1706118.1 hypothetical protein [Microbacterium sp. VKM Ac-2923]
MRRKNVLMTALVLTAVTALAGCSGGGADPTPSSTVSSAAPSPSPTPSATPSPTPTSTAAASVSIPTSCDDLGSAATREQTVGGLTAQHADGFVRPSPANATTDLSCNWIQEEAAAVLLIISSASAADVESGLAALPAQGYQCQASDDFGAQYCVAPGASTDTEDVVVARDGTWIYLETVNVNARAWLSEIASQIFG